MSRFRVLVAVLTLLVLPTPAWGQERPASAGIYLPREEAADLFGKAAEVEQLRRQVDLQGRTIELQEKVITDQARLLELKDKEIAGERKLAELEGQVSEHWQKRTEEAEGRACKRVREARVTGWAATGAALGSAVFPGAGTLAGAAIGAVVGFVTPCGG